MTRQSLSPTCLTFLDVGVGNTRQLGRRQGKHKLKQLIVCQLLHVFSNTKNTKHKMDFKNLNFHTLNIALCHNCVSVFWHSYFHSLCFAPIPTHALQWQNHCTLHHKIGTDCGKTTNQGPDILKVGELEYGPDSKSSDSVMKLFQVNDNDMLRWFWRPIDLVW